VELWQRPKNLLVYSTLHSGSLGASIIKIHHHVYGIVFIVNKSVSLWRSGLMQNPNLRINDPALNLRKILTTWSGQCQRKERGLTRELFLSKIKTAPAIHKLLRSRNLKQDRILNDNSNYNAPTTFIATFSWHHYLLKIIWLIIVRVDCNRNPMQSPEGDRNAGCFLTTPEINRPLR